MCDTCTAHSPFTPTPSQDYDMDGAQSNRAERILVIEITNLRSEIRALEITGQQARAMQIRTAGHAEALPSMEGRGEPKREMGDTVTAEPSYIEQIRYLIYQLKGAREHLAASIDHLDTVI